MILLRVVEVGSKVLSVGDWITIVGHKTSSVHYRTQHPKVINRLARADE